MHQRRRAPYNFLIAFLVSILLINHILPSASWAQQADSSPATPAPNLDEQGIPDNGESQNKLFLPTIIHMGSATPVATVPVATIPVDPAHDHATHDHGHDDYALAELARQRNEPPFVATQADAAATDPLNQVGQWGALTTWPFVFATAANPTSFSGGTSTYASVWNPTNGQFQSLNHSSHCMFCAIPTMLEDGRVFVNGGDGTRERTSIFDYRTNA